jgi:hypothetical protein
MCGRATYKLTWEEIVALPASATDAWPLSTHTRQSMLPVIRGFCPLPPPKRSTRAGNREVRSP